MATNEERLRDAGVINEDATDLQEPFKALVEGLTPHEVDVLVAVRRRLDEADRTVLLEPDQDQSQASQVVFMAP
jgi:hypothetical protein